MLAVIILCATCILLFISFTSIVVQQRHQIEELNNKNNNNQTKQNLRNHKASSDTSIANIDNNQSKNYCLTPDCVKVAASVIEAIDLTVNPCDDFYVSYPNCNGF